MLQVRSRTARARDTVALADREFLAERMVGPEEPFG